MRLTKRYKIYILLGICFWCSQYFYASEILASPIEKERVSGTDRYQTATAISQKGWESSDYAILVRGDDFADGLSAFPLAHRYSAPILMTRPNNIDNMTIQELKRLGVKHLIIIGGFGAVSQNVEDTIKREKAITIERIYGDNRYQTSAKIAERFSASEVALISGDNYSDALSVAVIAAIKGMPILLTPKESLPIEVNHYLLEREINKTYIIGGLGVISPEMDNRVPKPLRLAGGDRFETNSIILNLFASELSFNSIYIAGGDEEFAHALVGGLLAARTSSPLVFTDSSHTLTTIKNLQDKLSQNTRIIGIGSEKAVSSDTLEAIESYVADSYEKETDTIIHSDRSPPNVVPNKVSSVGSTTVEGYYKEGDIIFITVNFDGDVEVTGTPSISLAMGKFNREAAYVGGSGTPVLTFEYRVQIGDTSSVLDYVGTDSFNLNGGKIKSVATNKDVETILAIPGESGSLSKDRKIIIDTTTPTALDISLHNSIPANGEFSLSVEGGPLTDSSWQNIFEHIKNNTQAGGNWITGIINSDLTMVVAENGVTATIINTSGQEGIITQDFVIPAPEITDRAGNTMSENMFINSYIVGVTEVGSSTVNGYYKEGETINITIHFSGDVDVIGNPLLRLETGELTQDAIYTDGSGTSALSFTYTVQPGDASEALDYLGHDSLNLNGGSIKATDDNEDVLLALSFPGETGSLSVTKNIVIDTIAPSGISISSQNIIPSEGGVDLYVEGGPLLETSWLAILSEIKSNIILGTWIKGIEKNQLLITINGEGASATLHNTSPTTDALVVSDFIIPNYKVVDRAGNVALSDIHINSSDD